MSPPVGRPPPSSSRRPGTSARSGTTAARAGGQAGRSPQARAAPRRDEDRVERARPAAPTRVAQYTIREGGPYTFDTIATELRVRRRALMRANPGVDAETLRVGQRLDLPTERVPRMPRLPTRPGGARFTYPELRTAIERSARNHRISPMTIAGIIAQESSYRNLVIHRDGTGRGLIGLDSGGQLDNYLRWAGAPAIDPEGDERVLTPELQIEFLAMRIREMMDDNHWTEARAIIGWHASARFDSEAREYGAHIRRKIAGVRRGDFDTVP